MEKTTEEKILAAAEDEFVRNGFEGTKMRDIAGKAGVNLALINYYFGSKQSLFETVMGKALIHFRDTILGKVHDGTTDLSTKFREIVEGYSRMLKANPLLPSFVMNEISRGMENFAEQFAANEVYIGSAMQRQLIERGLSEEQSEMFMVNMFSLLVGGAVTSPITKIILKKDATQMDEFKDCLMERLPKMLESLVEIQKNL